MWREAGSEARGRVAKRQISSDSMHQVQTVGTANFPIVILKDGQGSEVHVAPAAGFNAFVFRVRRGDEIIPILLEPETQEELHGGGFSFGLPILFPFPNRTRRGRYLFGGQEHQLDINWKDGNAIHGLVCDRPWHIDATQADENGACVSARFQTGEHAEVMRQYSFDCELTVSYLLRNGVLSLYAAVRNTGKEDMPMGFGIHPWFHAPLTKAGKREDCILTVPARARWELESEEQLLPTGRVLPLEGKDDWSRGAPLADHFLDDVFTDLVYDGDEHICSVRDDASRVLLEVRAGKGFREHVVYAPLDQKIVCLEPYTQTTDFVNLHARGVDAGLIALPSGGRWSGDIHINPVFL